jgi:hypothetical protein
MDIKNCEAWNGKEHLYVGHGAPVLRRRRRCTFLQVRAALIHSIAATETCNMGDLTAALEIRVPSAKRWDPPPLNQHTAVVSSWSLPVRPSVVYEKVRFVAERAVTTQWFTSAAASHSTNKTHFCSVYEHTRIKCIGAMCETYNVRCVSNWLTHVHTSL